MNPQVSIASELVVAQFQRDFLDTLRSVRGVDLDSATSIDCYQALAATVRRYLLPPALDTRRAQVGAQTKWAYYLSAEYLLGRQLDNNLLSAGLTDIARQALAGLGLSLDALREVEVEPGLGNGGLGRLAACYLDSAATLRLPVIGYGINYEYGIFRQSFADGWQVEHPDDWKLFGNPWELAHPELAVTVGFGGQVTGWTDGQGNQRFRWRPDHTVLGVPYYYLVPGYRSGTINSLRLWSAEATHAFNLQIFNRGDFTRAVQDKVASETLSKVLYPVDETPQGRQLRLEQQYFFVACSLRDILRRLPDDVPLERLHERTVIQLNDTHPTIGIAELMRLLVDEYLLPWERAWDVTRQAFAYTCHTLLPEALEKWPISLFEQVLPRHLQIIYEINARFLDEVRKHYPGDDARVTRMSIIEEGSVRQVRMAHLAVAGSFKVNGVAPLHSTLLRDLVLKDFSEYWPEKFTNVTNGVTPRRFVRLSNPHLAGLITSTIGDGWLTDLNHLKKLEPHAEDPEFRARWQRIKQQNKELLASIIHERTGDTVPTEALYDIMAKRLHEYKRQLLKVLHIITLYNRIKTDPHFSPVPRVVCFGAKAAPGYVTAKLIIKLVHSVGDLVNNDPDVGDKLKVVFLPNFNVTLAERIYPAADLSEQISLAGKEASGTGNMKFALNGALTIGTLDGANVDIFERVGAETFFLFGLTVEEVEALRNPQGGSPGYDPRTYYARNPALKLALDQIASGVFSPAQPDLFQPIVDSLLNRDEYLLLADYQDYIDRQDEAEEAYRDTERWTRMSILNTARCGYFSSDRSVNDYATSIWRIKPVDVPAWQQAHGAIQREDGRRPPKLRGVDLTDAEWQLLTTAPVTIATVMTALVDTGVIGSLSEEGTITLGPAQCARRYPRNALIQAVLGRMKEQGRLARIRFSFEDTDAPDNGPAQGAVGLDNTIQMCGQIAALLASKVPQPQAEEFKGWLLAIAETAVSAGVQDFDPTTQTSPESDLESTALSALSGALRVNA
ncbi:MAG: glycogen/starch/alpha-glucan phosphorylase [Chloroflexia bacterium]